MNDGAYYPSRSGFKTSNTRAQIQNIISTTGISDNISNDVLNLCLQTCDPDVPDCPEGQACTPTPSGPVCLPG